MENIATNQELGNESSEEAAVSPADDPQDSMDALNNDMDVASEDDLIYEKEEKAPKLVSPYDRPGKWYVVHTQSGYENKVQGNLAQRIQSMNKEDSIHEVVIPLENVVEFKQGKRLRSRKNVPWLYSCSVPYERRSMERHPKYSRNHWFCWVSE